MSRKSATAVSPSRNKIRRKKKTSGRTLYFDSVFESDVVWLSCRAPSTFFTYSDNSSFHCLSGTQAVKIVCRYLGSVLLDGVLSTSCVKNAYSVALKTTGPLQNFNQTNPNTTSNAAAPTNAKKTKYCAMRSSADSNTEYR